VIRAGALVLAMLLAGCGQIGPPVRKSAVTIMTALPLFWGEGGAQAVVQGGDQRAGIVQKLEAARSLIPIETLDATTLAKAPVLFLAQPRLLSGEELVALDAWVRGGGRALVFADPHLVWSSNLPLGDRRRAPPVTLLDPLLTHWGLALDGLAEIGTETFDRAIGRRAVQIAAAGKWRLIGAGCRIENDGLVALCRFGKGQVILVADADVLDARIWSPVLSGNAAAVESLLLRLEAGNPP
jgi:hypothetical protein